jgi:hypothetical protein
MSCPTINEIPSTQCIGNSLQTINFNFSALKVAACDNYSYIQSLNTSILNLNTQILNLSSITVPGASKAWINFSGTRDNNNNISSLLTPRFIFSAYNINQVLRKGSGDYRITFTNRLPAPNYTAIGTSRQTIVGGEYSWLQPYNYNSSYLEVKVLTRTGTPANPENISIVIF